MKKLIIVALSLIVIFSCLGWQVQAKNQSPAPNIAANIKAQNGETSDGIAFIKFDGIDGESTQINHQKWSYLVSFDQLIQASGGAIAGGARAGRVSLEDILVNKMLDKSSPKLAEACIKGKVFPKVQIDVCKYGENVKSFYYYELKNVQITKYWVRGGVDTVPNVSRFIDTGRSTPGMSIPLGSPLDELALSFEEIKVKYTPYNADGSPGPSVEYSWNVRTNR